MANAAATQRLYERAEIDTASRKQQHMSLNDAASKLDDVELDSALNAALRGDYTVAADRLTRTLQRPRATKRKRPRGWTPWRVAMFPRRNR